MGKKKEEREFDRGKLKDTKENICGEGEERKDIFQQKGNVLASSFSEMSRNTQHCIGCL